jgi:hypothetical protein
MGRHEKGMSMRKSAFMKLILILAIVAVYGFPQAAPTAAQTTSTLPIDPICDEIARFISGIHCTAENLKALQETPEWKKFADGLEKHWADMESKRLQPTRAWAEAELAEPKAATKVLFYPFGGPDFLTAFDLFPNADTYVLLGLEFVGKLPEFDKAAPDAPQHVETYLANLNAALSDFFNKSYFITKNMDATLTSDKVDGVLPVICFFLKRTNNTISAVKRCEFLDKGELMEYDYSLPRKRVRRPSGIKIEFFANGTNRLRTLYYFSCDLVDDVFKKDSTLYLYLDGLEFETTFIKSASYLMHFREFSSIRDMILNKSRFVLEDDTGIPFRYFPAKDWDAQLYGEYIKPVSDFKGVEQFDLEAAYADAAKVKKLPFHLGYHWGTNKDSILYFKKKSARAAR